MQLLHFLVIFTISSQLVLADTDSNKVDDTLSAYAEAAADLLKDKDVQDLGGMVSDFIQSDNGKQLGDMLMGSVNKEGATQQILQGLGSIINQKEGGNGLDPTLVGNMIGSAFKSLGKRDKEGGNKFNLNLNADLLGTVAKSVLGSLNKRESKSDGSDAGGIDIMSMISLFGSFLNQGEGKGGQSLLSLIPTLISFMGPRSGEENRPWFSPSILEKAYELFGSFINSDIGKNLMSGILGQKIVKVFADKDGKFSAARTMELLENHSFRKHWIQMVTQKIASVASYFANPETQKQFVKTLQYFSNSFLKSQGFPKAALYDPERPAESLTAMVNYASKKYLNHKISSKEYVKPAVEYVQDLLRMAEQRGIVGSGIDSKEFSDKLADTLNLEIIEPVVRVYRAFRFVKKYPKCDKYVFCLINQDNQSGPITLPGLKKGLSRTTSLLVSWFVTRHSGSSFWTLYDIITEDQHNCKVYYLPPCNDFHLEEEKVTTEYIHSEL